MTSFHRWRTSLGWSIAEAARRLGLSVSRASDYDKGVSRLRGNATVPDARTRLAMAALAKRPNLEPWPLEPDEEAVAAALTATRSRARKAG